MTLEEAIKNPEIYQVIRKVIQKKLNLETKDYDHIMYRAIKDGYFIKFELLPIKDTPQ